jgi:hypothetical protein
MAAITITSNRRNASAVVHFDANASLIVTGNSSVANTIATGDEVLTGASISQVFAGCDGTGYIRIARGGKTVAIYDSTGYYDYAGSGMALNINPAANVDVTFFGSANCYLMVELQKIGTFNTAPYLVR